MRGLLLLCLFSSNCNEKPLQPSKGTCGQMLKTETKNLIFNAGLFVTVVLFLVFQYNFINQSINQSVYLSIYIYHLMKNGALLAYLSRKQRIWPSVNILLVTLMLWTLHMLGLRQKQGGLRGQEAGGTPACGCCHSFGGSHRRSLWH